MAAAKVMTVKLKRFADEHVVTIRFWQSNWKRKTVMERTNWTTEKRYSRKKHRRKMKTRTKWCCCQQVMILIFHDRRLCEFFFLNLISCAFFRSIWMDCDKCSIVAHMDNEEIQYRPGTDDCPISTQWHRTGENVACWILGMRWIERRRQYIGQAYCSFDTQFKRTVHKPDAQR